MGTHYLILFAAGMLAAGPIHAAAPKTPAAIADPYFAKPRIMVATFLRAVGRGELRVFDRDLTEAMITPIHVEYVYELDDPVPATRIYSRLNRALPVPGCEDCRIESVSAELSLDGRIIDVEAHLATD